MYPPVRVASRRSYFRPESNSGREDAESFLDYGLEVGELSGFGVRDYGVPGAGEDPGRGEFRDETSADAGRGEHVQGRCADGGGGRVGPGENLDKNFGFGVLGSFC